MNDGLVSALAFEAMDVSTIKTRPVLVVVGAAPLVVIGTALVLA
jgi:hypothetical protein